MISKTPWRNQLSSARYTVGCILLIIGLPAACYLFNRDQPRPKPAVKKKKPSPAVVVLATWEYLREIRLPDGTICVTASTDHGVAVTCDFGPHMSDMPEELP